MARPPQAPPAEAVMGLAETGSAASGPAGAEATSVITGVAGATSAPSAEDEASFAGTTSAPGAGAEASFAGATSAPSAPAVAVMGVAEKPARPGRRPVPPHAWPSWAEAVTGVAEATSAPSASASSAMGVARATSASGGSFGSLAKATGARKGAASVSPHAHGRGWPSQWLPGRRRCCGNDYFSLCRFVFPLKFAGLLFLNSTQDFQEQTHQAE